MIAVNILSSLKAVIGFQSLANQLKQLYHSYSGYRQTNNQRKYAVKGQCIWLFTNENSGNVEEKEKWLTQVIEKIIEPKGYDSFKANLEPYERPAPLVQNGTGDVFTPDITAVRNNQKSYFEIAQKGEDINRIVSKWKLMSTLANMKGGKFYLVSPRGHFKFTEDLVSKYHLEPNIIKLN